MQTKNQPVSLMATRQERLNQPRVTRLEALAQFRATGNLSPNAEREYQKLKTKFETKQKKQKIKKTSY
jgi:hypothetical protein